MEINPNLNEKNIFDFDIKTVKKLFNTHDFKRLKLKIEVTVEIVWIKEIMEVGHVDNSKTLSQYPHKRLTDPKINTEGLPYIVLLWVDYEVLIPFVPDFKPYVWAKELTQQFTAEFNMELKSQIKSIKIVDQGESHDK